MEAFHNILLFWAVFDKLDGGVLTGGIRLVFLSLIVPSSFDSHRFSLLVSIRNWQLVRPLRPLTEGSVRPCQDSWETAWNFLLAPSLEATSD